MAVLGQTLDDEAVRTRVVNAVVASPRATLVPVPYPVDPHEENEPCSAVGAAWNFAAHDMAIKMQLGSVLRTRLSNRIEGVWYPRACGKLGTLLVLEMKDPLGGYADWIELGRDGAADQRCGPSMGTARIRVRFRPRHPGNYVLRATVLTYAIADPASVDARDAVVRDQVYIHLNVIDQPVAEPLPYQEPASLMPQDLLGES